jgi:hypothetical protein
MAIKITREEYNKKFGIKPDIQTPSKPTMPILTNEQGGFGTALKDIAVGAGKSFIEGAVGTAKLFQGGGQRILAAIDPTKSLEEIRQQTGFKSLDSSTPEGAGVDETLRAKSRGEQVGKVLGTVGELGVGFVKTGAQAALKSRSLLKAETKSSERAIESITPKTKDLTPTEYEDLLAKNKVTPKTKTSPATYILSESEKANALKYKNLLQSNDPVKNSINVINEIARKDAQVGDFLRKNNGIYKGYDSGELKNSILKSLEGVDDVMVDEARLLRMKNTIIDGFIRSLPKNDMETLWKSRKAFDKSIEKVFSGSPTLQNTIKKEFRNGIQDFISTKTPDGVYKNAMKEMRELFNLHDTIATKATKERSVNAIQNWIKNNPTKAKIIGWTSGLIGAQQAYQMLK